MRFAFYHFYLQIIHKTNLSISQILKNFNIYIFIAIINENFLATKSFRCNFAFEIIKGYRGERREYKRQCS